MKVYVILNPTTGTYSKGGFYPEWTTALSGAKFYKRLSDVKKVIRSRPSYWQKRCYDFSNCLILEYNISIEEFTSTPAAQFILQ